MDCSCHFRFRCKVTPFADLGKSHLFPIRLMRDSFAGCRKFCVCYSFCLIKLFRYSHIACSCGHIGYEVTSSKLRCRFTVSRPVTQFELQAYIKDNIIFNSLKAVCMVFCSHAHRDLKLRKFTTDANGLEFIDYVMIQNSLKDDNDLKKGLQTMF